MDKSAIQYGFSDSSATNSYTVNNNQIIITPDLSTTMVSIDGNFNREGSFVKVRNMLGKNKLYQDVKEGKTLIDLSLLPKAIYFIELYFKDGNVVQKITLE
jgi:hypothetical protein